MVVIVKLNPNSDRKQEPPTRYQCDEGKQKHNTLRPRQNGRHFADDIFKCIFLNENI